MNDREIEDIADKIASLNQEEQAHLQQYIDYFYPDMQVVVRSERSINRYSYSCRNYPVRKYERFKDDQF